jgi:hypothetical protein
MITPATLLAGLQSLLGEIEDDIRQRAADDPAADAALRAEHADAVERGRTATGFLTWRDERVTQAAVGWLLSSTFVRFAEDNGLVDEHRLAGPGDHLRYAREAQTAYFQAHPHRTDRDYLLDVFDRVAALPGMGHLFDRAHNPLYQLEVSGDGASKILAFWRRQHDDAEPGEGVELVFDFRDPKLDTRFLGDLYQDLSDDAKKRFALLQTPEFVEEFILDRTLTPTIETFGLADTHLIDPTCGSGHFLLGAFARLLDAWQRQEPATGVWVLARRALGQVVGVDLNPFAVAVARFRMLVAALRACNITRLAAAPDFTITIATGDSLLRHRQDQLPGLDDGDDVSRHSYATEDAALLDRIFGRTYEAVVGNPPYITVKDKAAGANYRRRYDSCHRQYSLGVPFTERFLELARPRDDAGPAGFVGMITANSFMKREFGKKLVEQVLPEKDLTTVVDTSGAYIPGHGTPTVILFARNQWPVGSTVRMALGIRGEPSRPDEPSKGLVWRAIVDQLDHPGSESAYASVNDTARSQLASHPWSIGGGGASELKDGLNRRARRPLGSMAREIGYVGQTNADEVFTLPTATIGRYGFEAEFWRPFVTGDQVRDWIARTDTATFFPYAGGALVEIDNLRYSKRLFDRYRVVLENRATFTKQTYRQEGRPWWEWHQVAHQRLAGSVILFAFVASHNHFVLDSGGKVFNRSAPVIKLPGDASEEQHLRLLGLLNSSVGCFWMQQVFHDKGNRGTGGGIVDEGWERFYEFDATKLQQFPVVDGDVTELARRLDRLAADAAEQTPAAVCRRQVPTREALATAREEWVRIRAEQMAAQEELDWRCLHLYGVTDEDLSLPASEGPRLALGERAFEVVLARRIAAGDEESVWFTRHRCARVEDLPERWPDAYTRLVEKRIALITHNRDVALVERAENKRRWATEPWEAQEKAALRGWLLDRMEARGLWFEGSEPRVQSIARLTDRLRTDSDVMAVLALYAGAQTDPVAVVDELVLSEAVPAVAAARYKASGLRKRQEWEATWELQRREDAGEEVGEIAVPPKYKPADFRRVEYWKARGKLDVPKERFVLYPESERDVDRTPVVGWAGWDHLQQVTAVATYAIERREAEAWESRRLVPLLAAWYEVLPWVRQWHGEPDLATGLRLGEFFTGQLDVRLQELGLTVADLDRWEPTARRGRRARKATTPTPPPLTRDDPS